MASDTKGHLDQVNPRHYRKENGVETIDYIVAICRDLPGDEAVLVGNIVRYISRYRQKHQETPEIDVKKAQWYIEKLVEVLSKKSSKTEMQINLTYDHLTYTDFEKGVNHQ